MISTKVLIGLNPISVNLLFNHSGLWLFLTILKNRPGTPGHKYSSSFLNFLTHFILLLKLPFIFLIFNSFKVPKPAAARSLAIPLTDKQSDLLGVKFISITGSSNPYIEAMGSPILCFPVNSIMPSCSSEIPILSLKATFHLIPHLLFQIF